MSGEFKTCFKCGLEKSLNDFYFHSGMKDNRLNKCKECSKKDTVKNRNDKKDYYKEYDRKRFKNDPKVKERHERYKLTENYKISSNKSKVKWINNNPEARKAHIILGNAVSRGEIIKPKECSKCGNYYGSRKLHAHHEDYDEPLEVNWVCIYCHNKIHNFKIPF